MPEFIKSIFSQILIVILILMAWFLFSLDWRSSEEKQASAQTRVLVNDGQTNWINGSRPQVYMYIGKRSRSPIKMRGELHFTSHTRMSVSSNKLLLHQPEEIKYSEMTMISWKNGSKLI